MTPRIDYATTAPEAVRAFYGLEKYLSGCGLERSLIELIKIRCSQINGCAYCLDMHTKDARAAGETEQRIYTLSAWYETPFFSDREQAALAWVERVTRIADGAPSDALYQKTREQFSEKEIADLTWAAVAINGWNRIALSFGNVAGTYQPPKSHA